MCLPTKRIYILNLKSGPAAFYYAYYRRHLEFCRPETDSMYLTREESKSEILRFVQNDSQTMWDSLPAFRVIS